MLALQPIFGDITRSSHYLARHFLGNVQIRSHLRQAPAWWRTFFPSFPKREPSPPPVYARSTNKRKNFRPVSLNDRNSTNLQHVESTLEPPSTFVSELASVPTKTTSVIVRAPTKEDRSEADERFGPDREDSTSEPTCPPDSTEESSRYVFRGPPSFDQRQAQLRQDLYNASISPNSSSFYQTQVFPFMDYRNFTGNFHDRKHKRK